MPELIECRIIAETLHHKCVGKHLLKIDVDAKLKTKDLESLKTPAKIIMVNSYGKKIIFCLDNGQYIVNWPLMDGRWTFEPMKHTRATFSIGEAKQNGIIKINIPEFNIYYDGSFRFGGLNIVTDIKMELKKLGPDPFYHNISKELWLSIFRKNKVQKWEISKALLEQDLIAGIGNWMKAEILYEAKISPYRLVSKMSDSELELCRVCFLEISQKAYTTKGLTIATYWSPDGSAGTYPRKVYDKKQDPLGNAVQKDVSTGSRTHHWVPAIQK